MPVSLLEMNSFKDLAYFLGKFLPNFYLKNAKKVCRNSHRPVSPAVLIAGRRNETIFREIVFHVKHQGNSHLKRIMQYKN